MIQSPFAPRVADLAVRLCALLALSSCVSAHNSAVNAEYGRQVSTASLRVAELEQALADALARIDQLEEVIRVQGQSEAARLENIDQVNAEVARLRGAIEVLQFETGELKRGVGDQQIGQEQRLLYSEMRLRQIEKMLQIKPPPPPVVDVASAGAAAPPVASAGETPVPAPEEPIEELPKDAAGKLEVAAGHMEAGRHAVARAILQRALDENPTAPELDEVRYRYAETYSNEEKWRESVLEYQKVIDNHASSEWACWSFYRQGEAVEALQGLQSAAPFYKGAAGGACKSSEAAKLAKKKL